jgi:hypothetical protein
MDKYKGTSLVPKDGTQEDTNKAVLDLLKKTNEVNAAKVEKSAYDANNAVIDNKILSAVEGGALLASCLSSSNANQYFDNVTLFYQRTGNTVFVFGSFRLRSTPAATLSGQIIFTPPQNILAVTTTNTTISPGHIWRADVSIAGDNEYVKYDAANARIISNGTLDSVQPGLMYGISLMYSRT